MTTTLFTPADTAVVLIDHQVGTMGWVRSATFDDMKLRAPQGQAILPIMVDLIPA